MVVHEPLRYLRGRTTISDVDLQERTSEFLRRAKAGEQFEITRDGRSVAYLTGITAGWRRWVPVEDFMRLFDVSSPPMNWKAFVKDVSEGIDHEIRDPYERRS